MKFDKQLARDGSVSTTWKALYAALASFAEQDSRETPNGTLDDDDVPTRQRLAECIGKSVDTVDRATKGLEELGLLEVERRKDPDNPKRNIPSLYRLLDHELWDERAAARAAARKAEREARAAKRKADAAAQGGGRMGAATPGRTHAATLAAPMRPGWPHQCGGSSSSLEDLSLKNACDACDESEKREREAAAPEDDGADRVVDAYEVAAGRRLLNGTRTGLRAQAVELLAAGRPVEWVAARAAEMPGNGWTDLVKHCERSRVPIPGQAGPGQGAGGRERCADHPARYRAGCLECAMAVPA
ncbi:helix-turn-helix domain-containing protein [Streptomyces sp. NBC_00341]|uniref:hypothetical protein n=1 Tax=Streptomyces sp. NBC_00341 TaxID=2975717 RepID=UPI00308B56D3|nr:helix-turn-helix domain-containing protein [Streptomyces sp. NBC_00341]